jgi:tetratricopeptide (TPR) repeat protein
MQGKSLLSLPKSDHSPAVEIGKDSNLQQPVYAESDYGHRSFGWSALRAWRTGRYLYIEAPERELYDQSVDPKAVHNLAPNSKAVADTAAGQVAEFYRKTRGDVGETTKLSFAQTESLHALGYLSADAGISSEARNESGPDPKQKIAVANLLHEGLLDMENEQYQEAVTILEQVLKQEPNAPAASLQLGRAYMSLKEYQKAITPLQNLVDKRPDNTLGRYELGCALVKTGHWEEAAQHFEAAASQMPGSSMLHFYLALVYRQTSRVAEAAKEFQIALRLEPDNFPANLFLGQLYIAQHQAAEALPYLRNAARLHPDSIDAHGSLANAYWELGQQANARRELGEAESLRSRGGSRLGTPTGETDVATQR